MLKIPHCLDNRLTDGGKVVSPTHQPHFTPQKHDYFYVSGREKGASFLCHPDIQNIWYICIYMSIMKLDIKEIYQKMHYGMETQSG
jgi:hypothetical protein